MNCAIKLKGYEVAGSTFQDRKFIFTNRDISGDVFTAVVYNSFSKKNEIEGLKVGNEVFFPYSTLENLKTGRYRIEFWATMAGIGKEMIALEEFFVSSDPSCTNGSNETNVSIIFKEEVINFTIQTALMYGGALKWENVEDKPEEFPPSAHVHQWSEIEDKPTVFYDDTGIKEEIAKKVDKVAGKSLSTNDFTDAEKVKLASLENFDDSAIQTELDTKADLAVVDNIQIGGRNLILNSKKAPVESGNGTSLNLLAGGFQLTDATEYQKWETSQIPQGQLILSFKIHRVEGVGDGRNIRFYNGSAYEEIPNTSVIDGEKIVTHAFNNTGSINGFYMTFLTGGLEISWMKLEKGNKATDWTPAPEDKQDRLQDVIGNIGIGKTDASATEKLDVNGNVKAIGFKTPSGVANQALTADGGTFNLSTKADLVDGKVPSSQLPSYVDDVLEFANLASFPATGESGKIYIAIDTNITYRWTGTGYAEISASLALGETSSTAYRGDRGKISYDHSNTIGNPHGTTKADIGLGNVNNTSDLDKPISTATQNALNTKADLAVVDNIQIGGRNLILNSKKAPVESGNGTSLNLLAGGFQLTDATEYQKWETSQIPQGQLILSFKIHRVEGVGDGRNIRFYNGSAYEEIPNTSVIDGEKIVTHAFNNTGSINGLYMTFLTGGLEISWMKLEKGNKATDWTPAPEDIQTALDGKLDKGTHVGIGTTSPSYPLHVATQVSNTSIYAAYDIVAFSDISVKNNIRPIDNVLERVINSRGVLYDRIDSGEKNNIGFIAQELEEQFPELIVENPDGTKAVKYQNAVAILFEAIKEQQKQINELRNGINQIERRADRA